jgi:uncharacterized protein
VLLLPPEDQHSNILRKLLIAGQARGPRTTDAQLAALTIEYGGVLHTTDRDFGRFAGLAWPIRSKLGLGARKTQISC